ncbi:hypothetical protein ACWENO_14005 [Streptomyces sp. NPDC004436]
MIQPGQIYRAVRPNPSDPEERHIRIKVVGVPASFWGGKVDVVTLTDDGRELRRRAIEATQLHESATTRDGLPRRNGYVLEDPS